MRMCYSDVFFYQAEDGIRDVAVTGVQTCALPISALGDDRKRPRTCEMDRRTTRRALRRRDASGGSAGAAARCFSFAWQEIGAIAGVEREAQSRDRFADRRLRKKRTGWGKRGKGEKGKLASLRSFSASPVCALAISLILWS